MRTPNSGASTIGRHSTAPWESETLEAVELFLAHGADPHARTRIDDCTTPLEDAERTGFSEAVPLLKRRIRKER